MSQLMVNGIWLSYRLLVMSSQDGLTLGAQHEQTAMSSAPPAPHTASAH